VHPLADGWQERQALHQLVPLLVHATLFGGSYGGQMHSVLRRYLA
jgi:fructosamine-3-kinase